jgi:hypothetical protein
MAASSDPFTDGLDYLYRVRSLALEPEMVDLVDNCNHQAPICVWIGENIESINRQLNLLLLRCQQCFHPWEQPNAQVFATPLATSYRVDALCNLKTHPITLLIDVGRVVPADWLRLVVHEYAHAYAGSPGHHPQFAQSLAHLCLGLEIPPPLGQPPSEESLQFFPGCRSTQDPLAFWRGEGELPSD